MQFDDDVVLLLDVLLKSGGSVGWCNSACVQDGTHTRTRKRSIVAVTEKTYLASGRGTDNTTIRDVRYTLHRGYVLLRLR